MVDFRVKHTLKLLVVAAKLTQGDVCHMDQILLTLGYLSMQYMKLLKDHKDRPGATAIINSVKKQWAAADQEVFIATVVLNPFFKTTPFTNHIPLTNAGIHTLLEHLWLCFFGEQNATVAPLKCDTQIADYLTGTGVWVDLQTQTRTKLSRT